MTGALTNHLWQSTMFAVVAGLLAAALRKNRAQVRHWVWFSASLKFLVPFAVLMSLGAHVQWAPAARGITTKIAVAPAVSVVMEQIAQPFPETVPVTRATRDWRPVAIFGVWVCGFLAIALIRFRGWLRIRAAIRASVPIEIPATVAVRSSPGLLEPGVVGVLRPILLLPEGIAERLTHPQLEAVLAHELCHVRRRDNLFASIHMLVEAVFWFHPLVWWIGARLVEERERACDEAVLSLGSEPRDYAEGILKVCKLYVESPLACVPGITGSDIKKRIEAIMTNRIVFRLNFGKKLALAAVGTAALVLPIVVGVMNAPMMLGQSAPPPAGPTIRVAPVTLPKTPPSTPPRTPQLIAQAQSAPLPGGGGRGMTPQTPLADAPQDEHDRRVADAQAKFGATGSPMARMYIQYGQPDEIEVRGSGAQIWRYRYLEDFRSNVEFEFAPGKTMQINWPPPVTYEGEPGVAAAFVRSLPVEFFHGSDPAAANTIAGLPGGHASMQIYPVRSYRILSAPMDSLSGPVDVVSLIRTRSGENLPGFNSKTASIRDYVKGAPAGPYTTMLTLDPGSYVCSLVVREQATGRMYGETINFEVK